MLPENCECRVMPCVTAKVPDLLPLASQAPAFALKNLPISPELRIAWLFTGNGSESSQ